jgi:hypothetical protein
MKQILRYYSARLWCLVGLAGIAISAAILLGEGQARILTAPSPIQSIKVQDALSPIIGSKIFPSGKIHGYQLGNMTPSSQIVTPEIDNDEKPSKKKLGLAILFWGVLAEKS